jgi:hypothetical protein
VNFKEQIKDKIFKEPNFNTNAFISAWFVIKTNLLTSPITKLLETKEGYMINYTI